MATFTTALDNQVQTETPPKEPVTEVPAEVNERGFMLDPSQWSPGAAWFLARRQGVLNWPRELTNDHWRIIDYMRSYYHVTGNAPSLRYTCRALGMTKRQFCRLFPGGLRTARRISGLPGPRRVASRRELSTAAQLLAGDWWERLTKPGFPENDAGKAGGAAATASLRDRPGRLESGVARAMRLAAGSTA